MQYDERLDTSFEVHLDEVEATVVVSAIRKRVDFRESLGTAQNPQDMNFIRHLDDYPVQPIVPSQIIMADMRYLADVLDEYSNFPARSEELQSRKLAAGLARIIRHDLSTRQRIASSELTSEEIDSFAKRLETYPTAAVNN